MAGPEWDDKYLDGQGRDTSLEPDLEPLTFLRGRELGCHVAGLVNTPMGAVEIARSAGYTVERCAELLVRSGYRVLAADLVWRDYLAANAAAKVDYRMLLIEVTRAERIEAAEMAKAEAEFNAVYEYETQLLAA